MKVLRKSGFLSLLATTLGALILSVMALGGCQRVTELSEDFDPRLRPEDQEYQFVIESHLAKDSIYDGPATDAHFVALPLGMKVRGAMASRKALAFGLTKAEATKRLAEQQQANQEALEVVISAYLPERKWNDLDAGSPTFRAYMVGHKGQRVEPFDRRRIKGRSAIHETLYFFWGPWSRLYLLRFPRTDAAGQPVVADGKSTLIMTGPPGQAKLELLWD